MSEMNMNIQQQQSQGVQPTTPDSTNVSVQQQKTLRDKAKQFVMDAATSAFKPFLTEASAKNYVLGAIFITSAVVFPPAIPICSAVEMFKASQAKQELKELVKEAKELGIISKNTDAYGGMKSDLSDMNRSISGLKTSLAKANTELKMSKLIDEAVTLGLLKKNESGETEVGLDLYSFVSNKTRDFLNGKQELNSAEHTNAMSELQHAINDKSNAPIDKKPINRTVDPAVKQLQKEVGDLADEIKVMEDDLKEMGAKLAEPQGNATENALRLILNNKGVGFSSPAQLEKVKEYGNKLKDELHQKAMDQLFAHLNEDESKAQEGKQKNSIDDRQAVRDKLKEAWGPKVPEGKQENSIDDRQAVRDKLKEAWRPKAPENDK